MLSNADNKWGKRGIYSFSDIVSYNRFFISENDNHTHPGRNEAIGWVRHSIKCHHLPKEQTGQLSSPHCLQGQWPHRKMDWQEPGRVGALEYPTSIPTLPHHFSAGSRSFLEGQTSITLLSALFLQVTSTVL